MLVLWDKIGHYWNVEGRISQGFGYYPYLDDYYSKVKIHGTHGGINVDRNGKVRAQSRNGWLSVGEDNFEFAAYVENTEQYWRAARLPSGNTGTGELTIYGEWFGTGIFKDVAASQVDGRYYGIFAVLNDQREVVTKPEDIAWMLPSLPHNAFVIPWYNGPYSINFMSQRSIENFLNTVNKEVAEVEAQDPLIYNRFGVKGIGEGLVFMPSQPLLMAPFFDVTFKAKGDKHKVFRTKKSASSFPINVTTVPQFAELVLTEQRLMQCAHEVCKKDLDFKQKLVGPFVAHVLKDVKKEAKDIVEANGLRWREVSQEISKQARDWYLKQTMH